MPASTAKALPSCGCVVKSVVVSANAPARESQNDEPNAAATACARFRHAAASARVIEPVRQFCSPRQGVGVLRVEIRDNRASAPDIRVVVRAEVVEQKTVRQRVPRVETVDQPHDVRPHFTRQPEVAGVEDVVVECDQPVGVVVEQHDRAAGERGCGNRPIGDAGQRRTRRASRVEPPSSDATRRACG